MKSKLRNLHIENVLGFPCNPLLYLVKPNVYLCVVSPGGFSLTGTVTPSPPIHRVSAHDA
jgi:hypothetical protein